MKVVDHLARAKKTVISFEILPPLKGRSIHSIYEMLDPLVEFKPPFINVTYHRFEYTYKKTPDGLFKKMYTRKRPGTVAICAAIMNRYGVDAVPHLTCGGFSVEETEDALIDLAYLGVDNVLLIRGDPTKSERTFTPESGGHAYALDLVRQVARMNRGTYLESDLQDAFHTDFCVGVAGYPEKHYEAPNQTADLQFLKQKIEAGAQYIVTQMFFDNARYFEFVQSCRDLGITVPIIPGLKPLTTRAQISGLPRTFHVNIPQPFFEALRGCNTDEDVRQVGIEWCIEQGRELKKAGVPCLHFYTMGQSDTMLQVAKGIL